MDIPCHNVSLVYDNYLIFTGPHSITGVSLQRLVERADAEKEVCRMDVRVEDSVFVVTCNLLYTLMVESKWAYRV